MPDMTWNEVWSAIDTRREAIGWQLADLYRETALSETTYRKMAKGTPVSRPSNRRKIEAALGWTPNSIDDILEGGEPELVGPTFDESWKAIRAAHELFAADPTQDNLDNFTAEFIFLEDNHPGLTYSPARSVYDQAGEMRLDWKGPTPRDPRAPVDALAEPDDITQLRAALDAEREARQALEAKVEQLAKAYVDLETVVDELKDVGADDAASA